MPICKSGSGDEPHLLLDYSVLSEHTAQLQNMMTSKVEVFAELATLGKVRRILLYVDQAKMLANFLLSLPPPPHTHTTLPHRRPHTLHFKTLFVQNN